MKRQFSKKILGNKESTYLYPHRMSVKIYNNGIVIKPIGKQGICCPIYLDSQIENQKPIFLTSENVRYLNIALDSYKTKKDMADKMIASGGAN